MNPVYNILQIVTLMVIILTVPSYIVIRKKNIHCVQAFMNDSTRCSIIAYKYYDVTEICAIEIAISICI